MGFTFLKRWENLMGRGKERKLEESGVGESWGGLLARVESGRPGRGYFQSSPLFLLYVLYSI